MSDGAEAFEAALRENPDDLAGWSAYADWLAEHGDPRGELMRVQLALEDESLPKAERAALRAREGELIEAHCREFVGPAFYKTFFHAPGRPKVPYKIDFRRGWLSLIGDAALGDAEAPFERFLRAPELRWVQSLRLAFAEPGLVPLTEAVFAPVLRSFVLDSKDETGTFSAYGLTAFLATTPRLERLTVNAGDADTDRLFAFALPNLTALAVHAVGHYPTDTLAANRSLTRLRKLAFHPHAVADPADASLTAADLRAIADSPNLPSLAHLELWCCTAGDEGCDVLAESGLIRRLEVLDLSHGPITDAGALTLTAALRDRPHRLRLVKLEDNAITRVGLAALRSTGVAVEADHQHRPGDENYLFHGDME